LIGNALPKTEFLKTN